MRDDDRNLKDIEERAVWAQFAGGALSALVSTLAGARLDGQPSSASVAGEVAGQYADALIVEWRKRKDGNA